MSNRAIRVKAAVITPAVATAAILAGILAAPQAGAAPVNDPVVHGQTVQVQPYSVHNFGLSKAEAKHVQAWLQDAWDYRGPIDGELGPQSWMAMQRFLAYGWHYKGHIDGIPGPNTVKALQRLLKSSEGYHGKIDGIVGPKTEAAFKRFVAELWV